MYKRFLQKGRFWRLTFDGVRKSDGAAAAAWILWGAQQYNGSVPDHEDGSFYN